MNKQIITELQIESPCMEEWNKMSGDDSIRHCSKCRFNVYNFAEMTEEEINEILKTKERLCVRLYLRPDGTYMTKDCRAKLSKKKKKMYIAMIAVFPFSLLLFNSRAYEDAAYEMRQTPVIGDLMRLLSFRSYTVMGARCPPKQKSNTSNPPNNGKSSQKN